MNHIVNSYIFDRLSLTMNYVLSMGKSCVQGMINDPEKGTGTTGFLKQHGDTA